MQSAYEVLSDPQERAWYDTHRDSILWRGDVDGDHYEHNTRVTTAEDIMRFFSNINGKMDFSPSPTGFFGALGGLFDNLAKEEEAACKWDGLKPIHYPSFGSGDDAYEEVVRPFYSMWSSFTTRKSFSWKDRYRYSDASDRKIRRMMEKENKHLRDEGIREFNDAVRSLVAFVRKRDPRYRPNKQSEADRQKVLRDAAVAQAARSRAANQAKSMGAAIPEWMRASTPAASDVSDDQWAERDPAKQEVECVVCKKTFRSEKQYEAHERSKKHAKTLQQLRRQMQREDRELNLSEPEETHDSSIEVTADTDDLDEEKGGDGQDHLNVECNKDSQGEPGADTNENARASPIVSIVPGKQDSDSNWDEDYAPQEYFEQRLFDDSEYVGNINAPQYIFDKSQVDTLEDHETTKKTELGKAKVKRARKAERKSLETKPEFKCASCYGDFPSKNQLFKHIKTTGHAQVRGKEKGK